MKIARPFLFLILGSTISAKPLTVDAYTGDSETPLPGESHDLEHDLSSLRFQFTPRTARSLYRLEGLDRQWWPTEGVANVVIRFLDANQNQITRFFFPATGESRGWNGSVEGSEFELRRASVITPEGAKYVALSMSSSGPPSTVGIFAITGIRIQSEGMLHGGNPVDEFKPGLEKWNPSGTHPSLASSYLDQESGEQVFVIRDDDITAHADWEMFFRDLPIVKPGAPLQLEWRETYSIGTGGPQSISYERIPPGTYRFVVKELDLAGRQIGSDTSVDMIVTKPIWERLGFWLVMLFLAALLSGLIVWFQISKHMKRRQRHARLIADERLRIAGDLHDDLGSRLAHIHLLGSHAESTTRDQEAQSNLQRMNQMTGEVIGSLSETVWMLNTKNGNLESLVDFLCRLVGEHCKLADVRCRIDALSIDEAIPVSHEFRHNYSLAVKEAAHNALKHSQASEIRMKISKVEDTLTVTMTDNGIGMTDEPDAAGSGLSNIQRRMESIDGIFEICQPDEGLQINLSAPIQHTSKK